MLARIHMPVVLLGVSFLIGCSPGLVTEEDKTAAVVAKANAEAAARPKYSDGAVVQAALKGKKTVVEQALQDGNALTALNHEGFSALHTAALSGHLDIVKLLLENDADVQQRGGGDKAMTALHAAAYNGHTKVVRYLLDQGMKVDERDGEGKSALTHAASGPYVETATVLLDAGADINLADYREGFTPLMMAAAEGQLEVVKLLMSRGADATLVDKDGDSALSFAMKRGQSAVVAYLSDANKPKGSEQPIEKPTASSE